MSRRQFNRLVTGGLLALAASASVRAQSPKQMADRMSRPPVRRVFDSPSGRFQLVITTDDQWQTRTATGELRDQSNPAAPCWRQALPQTQGPRHVMVTDQGMVLMIDSWINSPSPHAVVLFAVDGKQRVVYSFDALVAKLGVSRHAMVENARLGVWLGAEPALSADGTAVVLAAAGRKLVLTLADGTLSAVD